MSWSIVEKINDSRIHNLVDAERKSAEREALDNSYQIESGLAYLRSIPSILASEKDTISFLTRLNAGGKTKGISHVARDIALKELHERLSKVRTDSNIDQIMLIDANGICVLAAGFEPWMPIIGSDVSDREYFQTARAGKNGRQFALGRTTRTPGIFFSAPVIFNNSFIGVVAIKSTFKRFQVSANAIVMDRYGVILLADDQSSLFSVLPEFRQKTLSEADSLNRYGRKNLPEIHFKPWLYQEQGGVFLRESNPIPLVHSHIDDIEDVISVHTFHGLEQIEEITSDGLILFIILIITVPLTISLIICIALYIIKQNEHNRSLLFLNEELDKQANTDSLTGCANRRCFFDALESEWQRATRYGDTFSLVTIDLDHFKSINDRFGHAGGDKALCYFVATAQSLLRPTDLLGRLGGEEFALLLPKTDIAGAKTTAERVRSVIESGSIEFGKKTISFTISAGVATLIIETKETIENLLGRCDVALYISKNSGRNRVELSKYDNVTT